MYIYRDKTDRVQERSDSEVSDSVIKSDTFKLKDPFQQYKQRIEEEVISTVFH